MPDPTGRISHLPDFHRGVSWKQPCRVATTASVTISTALNAGDTIDGVTLAAGDRVLVKDQSPGSQNGVYLAGVTPVRDFDMDQDGTTSVPASEVVGAIIYVVAGTANGGTLWRNTNTTAPTLGSTSLTFAQIPLSTDAPTTADYLTGTAQAGLSAEIVVGTTPGGELGGTWASPTVDATHSGSAHLINPMTTPADLIVGGTSGALTRLAKGSDSQVLTVDPTTHLLVWATPSGSSLTINDEGTPLASAATSLDFVGAGVVASGATAAKTVTIAGVTEASVRDAGRWEVLMSDGITSPPEPVWSDDGTDWLYGWVAA